MEGGIYIISSPYYYKLDCFLALLVSPQLQNNNIMSPIYVLIWLTFDPK